MLDRLKTRNKFQILKSYMRAKLGDLSLLPQPCGYRDWQILEDYWLARLKEKMSSRFSVRPCFKI